MNKIEIRSFDIDARGVGNLQNEDGTQGKVVFVEGALPGELVGFSSYKKKASWEVATMTSLHRESSQRVVPKCEFFGVCGGCSMQHLNAEAQVAIKQRVLEDNLWHIGKVRAETMLRPIYGPTWGYRYRARLSVRHVIKKGVVLVGFHEKKSRYVANMETCEILPPHVSAMLMPLRELIGSLSIIEQLPQIELAVGEGVTAMVLRIMATLTAEDEVRLKAFADKYKVEWWLQQKGPESATPYYPANSELFYSLPEFGVKMPFKPTDFTQVNHHINRVLVSRALRLLDVQKGERVADLFCGLGNFTLPIATIAEEVVGIEGSDVLTERARQNALRNGLSEKTSFSTQNLFVITAHDFVALGKFDRMLIDPPRDGAMAVCQALIDLCVLAPELRPTRLVYVSCSPSTLARDAGMLVRDAGYKLSFAGVVNMFPHTSHVESVAVFDLE
ncbi:MAG: 23S rRNA (uracil(1939)-C(5))-methyltransferase RlmD [Burkholderiales bacterium]|nr:23S rRNA (uracil(1939)-C(5))-methyltransferase RlmD [Burkholderiales bacterium]